MLWQQQQLVTNGRRNYEEGVSLLAGSLVPFWGTFWQCKQVKLVRRIQQDKEKNNGEYFLTLSFLPALPPNFLRSLDCLQSTKESTLDSQVWYVLSSLIDQLINQLFSNNMQLFAALQAPYMIYVEVLCMTGNDDDPFPSKQFQPTLRQTRSEEFTVFNKRSHFLKLWRFFFLPVDYHHYYYYYYYYFIFIRSEEHLPTYCRTEGVQFTVSGSINITKKIILGSPTSENSHLSLLLADMDVLFPLRNVLSSKEKCPDGCIYRLSSHQQRLKNPRQLWNPSRFLLQ